MSLMPPPYTWQVFASCTPNLRNSNHPQGKITLRVPQAEDLAAWSSVESLVHLLGGLNGGMERPHCWLPGIIPSWAAGLGLGVQCC